jgi:PIN domain nuclease of toxin-antitoxin system
MLVKRGRIRLERDLRTWVSQALALERVEALPLGPDVAIAAAQLPASFPGDPADRIIYSAAHAEGARLVTKDRAIRAFDRAGTLW